MTLYSVYKYSLQLEVAIYLLLWCINCTGTKFCAIISFFLTRYVDWPSLHYIVFQVDLFCWYRSMPLSSILSFFFNDFLPVFKLTIFPNHISESPFHSPDVNPYIFHGLTLKHALLCGMLPSGCFLETLPISLQVNMVSVLPLCPTS